MPIGAAQPSDTLHTWATDALTRVEPSSGQKATGYVSGERPTFNVINWLLGLLLDWAIWLRLAVLELDTDKIDRDGSVTMAGVFKPDVGTRDLGLTGTPFQTAYVKNYVCKELFVMDAAARVSADMLPSVDGVDLGSDALRFDAFLQAASIEGLICKQTQADIATASTSFDATNKSCIEVSGNTTPVVDTITGGVAGQRLTLICIDASGVTLTSTGGNLALNTAAGDWAATQTDTLDLIFSGTNNAWCEVARSVNTP